MSISKRTPSEDQDTNPVVFNGYLLDKSIVSWGNIIAGAPLGDRADRWREAVKELARCVAQFGADRAETGDALTELAIRHGLGDPLGGDDGIQQTIADAIARAERAEIVGRMEGAGRHALSSSRIDHQPRTPSWRDRFKLTAIADIELEDDPLWQVDGLIPAGPSLGVIFGKPKSGKTFLTTDLFLHVAMGRDYCGRAVQAGAVVYITKEGVRGFKRRMMALRQYREAGPGVPFYVAHEMPNFGTNCGDAEALVSLIRDAIPEGMPVAAVIIDTLARTMPGQSDSDSATMGMFVENCEAVARAFGCFVGAVHHSPRGDETRSRGSNVLDGAADVIISVVKDDLTGVSTATIEACKDAEEGALWRFELVQVGIGAGERRNNPCCAPTCATIGTLTRKGDSATRAQQRLTPSQRRFIDILAEAIVDSGATVPTSTIVPPGIKAVTREQLKKCLLSAGFLDADKAHSARTIFGRALNDLAGKHVIGTDAEHVWLPR